MAITSRGRSGEWLRICRAARCVCWSWELASDSKTLDLCFLLRGDDGAPPTPSTTRPDEEDLVTRGGGETPHFAKADRGSSLYQRSTWVDVTQPCTGSSIS